MNDLTIVIEAAPVLHIHKVGIFQCLGLIVFDRSGLGKSRIQLITGGMGDGKIMPASQSPFCKGIGYGMRNCLNMRRPSQYHLWSLFLRMLLFDCDHVSKALKRVAGGTFQTYHRNATIFDKLMEDEIFYILFFVGQ